MRSFYLLVVITLLCDIIGVMAFFFNFGNSNQLFEIGPPRPMGGGGHEQRENIYINPGSERTFTSPNYPQMYPINQNRVIEISTESQSKLYYECTGVIYRHNNCNGDSLEICTPERCSERLCGVINRRDDTKWNKITLKFRSNNAWGDQGYKCIIRSTSSTERMAKGSGTIAPAPALAKLMETTAPPLIPEFPIKPINPIIPTFSFETTVATTEQKCTCGMVNRPRIVGGVETGIHEYPWQVGLRFYGGASVSCGGTIISERWVLTAAHCTIRKSPHSITVIAGEHSLTTTSETTKTAVHKVEKIINHEIYNTPASNNDISLLKVQTPFIFDEYNAVSQICLPSLDIPTVGREGIVTGWGTTSYKGQTSSYLQETSVEIVTQTYCKRVYGSYITDQMLCAGTSTGGRDSCQGDSGGSLVVSGGLNNQSYVIVGVVSFGYKCGEPGIPGVYARVTEFLPWIKSKVGPSDGCFL